MTEPGGIIKPIEIIAIQTVPTQVRKPWQATIRTVLQLVLSIALVLPLVFAGVPAVGFIPGMLAVAAGLTRVMALPQVEELLSTYVPWLSAGGNK